MKRFNLIRQAIFDWLKGNSKAVSERVSEPLKVYKVSLNSNTSYHKEMSKKPLSAILKKCEGARGILYMSEKEDQPSLPHSVLKRTKIIEVKDVSMKIRVHEDKVVNQLVYIEKVLGFLKEVD